MKERIEKLQTSDGAMEVFVVHPDGDGPFPVLIELMDGLAMREELHVHARRVAAWGYYVMAPDFFHRSGLRGPIDPTNPEGMAKIMAAFKELTDARALSDIQDTLQLAAGDKAASKGKIGLYGFCMGGRLALTLSQALGERVAAGGSIHPGGLVTDQPNSPHKHLDQVKAEMYFGIADQDPYATADQMKALEQALNAQGVKYQLEWHPAALHGYMMPGRAEVYNKDAAEKVWGRLQVLFARTVKAA